MISLTAILSATFLVRVSAAGNCSLGIGRLSGSPLWDLTVYDVPQAAGRQDLNVLTTLKAQPMGKGDSITIAAGTQTITVTNVDDVPAFDYVLEVQSDDFAARWENPRFGDTKTLLEFSIPDAKYKWTTADCGPVNVVVSGGREGWSCDFPCDAAAEGTKEL